MRTSKLHREAATVIVSVLWATVLAAQPSATQQTPSHRTRPSAAHPTATTLAEAPPAPPAPNWPINDHPNPASVKWDGTGLRIMAANSSLQQILSDVTTATGTKVEGFGKDQRVYGDFGPGQPRDILAQLLQGTGYNIVMIGDQGRGNPREVLLSERITSAASQPVAHTSQEDNEDDYDNQVDVGPPQPAQPLQPQQPQPPARPGFGPEGPRSPQQIQQELMQRQQQILQQQMQQGVPMQSTTPQN